MGEMIVPGETATSPWWRRELNPAVGRPASNADQTSGDKPRAVAAQAAGNPAAAYNSRTRIFRHCMTSGTLTLRPFSLNPGSRPLSP